MPKLGLSNVQRIILPSSTPDDQAWVDIDLSPQAGLILDAFEGAEGSSARATALALVELIKQWNFADESGQTEPITFDNVRRMDVADFNHLDKLVQGQLKKQTKEALPIEEKKV